MLALFVTAALSAQPATPPTAALPCLDTTRRYTRETGDLRPRRLGELPPAVVMHTVEKRVGGCAVNVLMVKDASGRKIEVPSGPARARPVPTRR